MVSSGNTASVWNDIFSFAPFFGRTLASIAGGIVGSHVGHEKIKGLFFKYLENKDLLLELAKDLYYKKF